MKATAKDLRFYSIDGAVQELTRRVNKEYPERTGLKPEIYVCTVEDGAGSVE